MPLRRQDWTLLTVAAAAEHGLSSFQLQKVLFLLGFDLLLHDFYHFKPIDYGPVDGQVHVDVEVMVRAGLIVESQGRFMISPAGLSQARALAPQDPNSAHAHALVCWALQCTPRALVREVYRCCPAMREKCMFRV